MTEEKLKNYALKILRADREKLLVSLPFLARALYALEPVLDSGSPGAGTDGKSYFCDSRELVERFLSPETDTEAEYLHSVLHCLYLHIFFAGRHDDKELWNLASDISVFDILHSIGLAANEPAQLELDSFRNKSVAISAQSLYRFFKRQLSDGQLNEEEIRRLTAIFRVDSHEFWYPQESTRKENPSTISDEQEHGIVPQDNITADGVSEANSFPDTMAGTPPAGSATAETNQEIPTELMDKWKDIADSAEVGLQLDMKQKQRGDEAGHLLETLENIRRDELDYAKFLRKFAVLEEKLLIDMDAFDYNYYTYGLELYGDMPLIEPLEYKEEHAIRDFVIAIDTSGSCQLSLIRKFLEKTYSLLTETAVFGRKINVHIIQCDAAIQEDKEIHSEKELTDYIKDLAIKGRGGTDFRPVFAKIAEIRAAGGLSHMRGLIYFTDGYGIFPHTPTDYKTAFAFAERDDNVSVPPWAMKVYIEEEGLA